MVRWRALSGPLDGMTLTATVLFFFFFFNLARLARLATRGDAEWERAAQEYAVENEDAAAAAGKPKGAAVDLDEEILAAIKPGIDPLAFYGPLEPIVDAATAHSEATETASQCRSSPRSGRCCGPSTSISVTRSCRLIRF